MILISSRIQSFVLMPLALISMMAFGYDRNVESDLLAIRKSKNPEQIFKFSLVHHDLLRQQPELLEEILYLIAKTRDEHLYNAFVEHTTLLDNNKYFMQRYIEIALHRKNYRGLLDVLISSLPAIGRDISALETLIKTGDSDILRVIAYSLPNVFVENPSLGQLFVTTAVKKKRVRALAKFIVYSFDFLKRRPLLIKEIEMLEHPAIRKTLDLHIFTDKAFSRAYAKIEYAPKLSLGQRCQLFLQRTFISGRHY